MKYYLKLEDKRENVQLLIGETGEPKEVDPQVFAILMDLFHRWNHRFEELNTDMESGTVTVLAFTREIQIGGRLSTDYNFGIYNLQRTRDMPLPTTLQEFFNYPGSYVNRKIVGGINWIESIGKYTINT